MAADAAVCLQAAGTAQLNAWVEKTGMDREQSMVVIKPSAHSGGVGVSMARGAAAATDAAHSILAAGVSEAAVIEPKVIGATEFIVHVIETKSGPLALPPTTVELVDLEADIAASQRELLFAEHDRNTEHHTQYATLWDDEETDAMLTYERRHLPNEQLRLHTPALLPAAATQVRRRPRPALRLPACCWLVDRVRCRSVPVLRAGCLALTPGRELTDKHKRTGGAEECGARVHGAGPARRRSL